MGNYVEVNGPWCLGLFLAGKVRTITRSKYALSGFLPHPPYPDGFRRRMSHPLSSMYLYTRMAMPIAIRAKKTLDMNMMQRQETPPRMDKDLFGKSCTLTHIASLDSLTNDSTWTVASTLGFSRGTEGHRRGWQSRSTWGRTYWVGGPARPRCQWVWPPGIKIHLTNGKRGKILRDEAVAKRTE